MRPSIKAILFDLDDTLLKTREIRIKALIDFGHSEFGLILTEDTILRHWGEPFEQFFDNIFNKPKNTKEIIEKYLTFTADYPPIAYEDAVKTIEDASESFLLGVVSAAKNSLVKQDLIRAGFRLEWFDVIQGNDDTHVHKPNPEVFNPVLIRLREQGIENKEIVYIGDSLSDYYAARDAGLNFVGLHNRTVPEKRFKEEGATSVENIEQAVSLIKAAII